MRALERACVSLGVQFMEGAEVLDLARDSTGQLCGIDLRSAEGEQQRLSCQLAVLCSGAWSQQLVPELPVFPVKGQMLSLQGPREALKRVIFGPGTYLVPREDGLIVVGATSEREAGFTEGLTPDGQNNCKEASRACCPWQGTGPHGALVGLPALHTRRRSSARLRAASRALAGLRPSPQWRAASGCQRRAAHQPDPQHPAFTLRPRTAGSLQLEALREANNKGVIQVTKSIEQFIKQR